MFGTLKLPKTMKKYENEICLMKCLCENWICTMRSTKWHNELKMWFMHMWMLEQVEIPKTKYGMHAEMINHLKITKS